MRYDRNCAWDKIIGRLKWNKEILILFLPVWLPYLGIDPGMLPTSGYGLTYVRIHASLHEWLNASSCSLWLLSTQSNAADDTDKDIFDKLYQVIFRPPWYNVIIILTNARSTFSASSREMKCEKSVDFYKQIGTPFANKSTTDYGKCLLLLCQANDLCTTDIHFPANLTSSSSLTTGDLDQDLVGRFGPPQNNHGFHRNPPPLPRPWLRCYRIHQHSFTPSTMVISTQRSTADVTLQAWQWNPYGRCSGVNTLVRQDKAAYL